MPKATKAQPIKAKPAAVGQRIKLMRKEQQLSQRDIEEPGSSYAYLSRIENGTRNPSFEALIQIAAKLDTTGLYLLTGRHDADCPFCQRPGHSNGG